jgi:hypothetical protein
LDARAVGEAGKAERVAKEETLTPLSPVLLRAGVRVKVLCPELVAAPGREREALVLGVAMGGEGEALAMVLGCAVRVCEAEPVEARLTVSRPVVVAVVMRENKVVAVPTRPVALPEEEADTSLDALGEAVPAELSVCETDTREEAEEVTR